MEQAKYLTDIHFCHSELMRRGWIYDPTGPNAEGPSFIKKIYRLQIIQQSKRRPSVINEWNNIPGQQNLRVSMAFDTQFSLFFGYCDNFEDFDSICKMLRI